MPELRLTDPLPEYDPTCSVCKGEIVYIYGGKPIKLYTNPCTCGEWVWTPNA